MEREREKERERESKREILDALSEWPDYHAIGSNVKKGCAA